jgi:hypothetical protein
MIDTRRRDWKPPERAVVLLLADVHTDALVRAAAAEAEARVRRGGEPIAILSVVLSGSDLLDELVSSGFQAPRRRYARRVARPWSLAGHMSEHAR